MSDPGCRLNCKDYWLGCEWRSPDYSVGSAAHGDHDSPTDLVASWKRYEGEGRMTRAYLWRASSIHFIAKRNKASSLVRFEWQIYLNFIGRFDRWMYEVFERISVSMHCRIIGVSKSSPS